MNSWFKRIELLANVAIILVAILLGVVLARSYLFRRPSPTQTSAATTVHAGTKLSVPGIDWNSNGRTLVLALSTQCHFCTESAPFYHRVADERAKIGKLRLVAVLPQPVDESEKYLKQMGLVVDEVKQLNLDSLGVNGTPTLIMADSAGIVVDSWRGRLPAEKEADVLDHIRQPVQ